MRCGAVRCGAVRCGAVRRGALAGDYTLLEKLFGQTSNNKARMDLKAEVLAKANIPTNPSLVSGQGRSQHPSRPVPVTASAAAVVVVLAVLVVLVLVLVLFLFLVLFLVLRVHQRSDAIRDPLTAPPKAALNLNNSRARALRDLFCTARPPAGEREMLVDIRHRRNWSRLSPNV